MTLFKNKREGIVKIIIKNKRIEEIIIYLGLILTFLFNGLLSFKTTTSFEGVGVFFSGSIFGIKMADWLSIDYGKNYTASRPLIIAHGVLRSIKKSKSIDFFLA